ncbi:hypothetical protein ZWY2020_017362 [Hordeum vulgare]|nr:hypothetical protein ZWY2020_017362 [Hordeum vulgare]
MQHMRLLYELDVSNNLLSGAFPSFLTSLPSLKYLDLRFNDFDGELPDAVFGRQLSLDALFANDNRFNVSLASGSLTNSTASVIVLANTKLAGCLPPSIGDMADTLVELILLNTSISSCIPPEIGKLKKLKVLDLSHNEFGGAAGEHRRHGEPGGDQRGYNMLTGAVPEAICLLPNLKNLTVGQLLLRGAGVLPPRPRRDDRMNCIPTGRTSARTSSASPSSTARRYTAAPTAASFRRRERLAACFCSVHGRALRTDVRMTTTRGWC